MLYWSDETIDLKQSTSSQASPDGGAWNEVFYS